MFNIPDISNEVLTEDDIPPPRAAWGGPIERFCLTFDMREYENAERAEDSFPDVLHCFRNHGTLPPDMSLSDLRASLYFLQRSVRMRSVMGDGSVEGPEDSEMSFVHAVLERIQALIRAAERR